ncbi:MtnX-like HAD-IB family phosphatase [Rossellomorea vietnamensis]|uniref:MtnX-like HAD-IB family phosphatase n=1 Tax=Rossellomorea vietnamensis TaxID=218284 RepID=A0ACD4C9N3_9BACI|nr:MtnX-like HAD-IB family phosphatase [Rossellomorea vietnamensis]UXH44944.1 MtnX-like HAD-IB family phosphatase [Rossellomorea vietnamensis]WQI96301.1 MtnX-like HAD-IB family phosphatase [Rossellomorea vietnamensis]
MKKWAFVSDFDGTISKKDFYHLVMEKYFHEGEALYTKWKAGEMKDIDFLSTVFSSIHQDETQIIEDIHSLEIDEHVTAFIRKVQAQGGDFYILSAGTDYYIHHILQKYGITDVKVFSNEGYYMEKNVHMKIDPDHPHYSERYGIDKSTVISELKEEYEMIYFAGDSEPDSHPAEVADVTFAMEALQGILEERGTPFIKVNDFYDIDRHLTEREVLK